jgi:hypothetical protein
VDELEKLIFPYVVSLEAKVLNFKERVKKMYYVRESLCRFSRFCNAVL